VRAGGHRGGRREGQVDLGGLHPRQGGARPDLRRARAALPGIRFALHKGYCTPAHLAALVSTGPASGTATRSPRCGRRARRAARGVDGP
jgi:hypothetical protein